MLSPLLSTQGENANLNLGVKSPGAGSGKGEKTLYLVQTLNVLIHLITL